MVLPDAVDAQIFARITLANEARVFEKADRAGIAGNAGGFEAVQPQRAEGEWNDGAHRRGHVAVAGKWQAHPVAEAARLSDPAPNVGERQPADDRVVRVANDQEGIALVAAQVFGIAPDPASERAAAEIVGSVRCV